MRAWHLVVSWTLALVVLPLACDGSPTTDENGTGGTGGSSSDASGGSSSGGTSTGGGSSGGEAGATMADGGSAGSEQSSGGQGGFAGSDPGPIVPCPDLCHLAYAHCTGTECDSQDFECLDQCNFDRSDCLLACL